MEIKSQTIYGGHQYFADHIINQYPNLQGNDNAMELLKFIAELKIEQANKEAIAGEIALAHNQTAEPEQQQTARSHIMQFLLEHKPEITAWAGRVSKIAIGAILAQYGLSLADVGL